MNSTNPEKKQVLPMLTPEYVTECPLGKSMHPLDSTIIELILRKKAAARQHYTISILL